MDRKPFAADRRFNHLIPTTYVKQIFILVIILSFLVFTQFLRFHSYQPLLNAFHIEINHQQQSNVPVTICEQPLEPPPILQVPSNYPELFKQYARFHHQVRQCLENHVCSQIHTPNIIVYYNVALRGGLGDQIRAMMYVLFLAITSNRAFFIDNLNDSISQFQLVAAFVPNFINWQISPSIRSYISSMSTDSQRYFALELVHGFTYNINDMKTPIMEQVSEQSKYSVNMTQLNITQMSIPYKVVHLFARIRRIHMHTVAPWILKNRHPSISQTLATLDISLLDVQLTQMLFRPSFIVDQMSSDRTFPIDQPFIAIHIRTGVDTGENNMGRFDNIRNRYPETIQNVWNCMLRIENSIEPIQRVYIASDDIQFKKDFIQFGNHHNVTVKAVLNPILHTSTAISDPNNKTEIQCNGFLDAAADIFALAKGSSLISAKSTFADAAFQLGQMKHYQNIFFFVVSKQGNQKKQISNCRDLMLQAHPSLLDINNNEEDD